jgi:ferredoxin-NADP reductase
MNQAHSMLERKREHDLEQMAFLTILDPNADGVRIQHEVKCLLLRRPRITVTCRPGESVRAIRAAIQAHGWNEETDRQWFENNGQALLHKRQLVL